MTSFEVHSEGREKNQKPVNTGAVRHYVPEIGPSQHPFFEVLWQVLFQSPTLAEVLPGLSVFGTMPRSLLNILLVLSGCGCHSPFYSTCIRRHFSSWHAGGLCGRSSPSW